MDFSAWPTPARTPAEVLDVARLADDGRWRCVWYADHYMNDTGDTTTKGGPVHEAWALLPAIAAVTSQVRLGPLVAPTSIHHPALLANRAATIDQLSGGRFILGMGAGWQINEHAAYGFELEEPGPRVSRFEESIQAVRSLLDNDRTDFSGEFYNISDAPCDPKPVQDKLPILVGTGSPRMMRITARHAQEWNTWGAPDMAGEVRTGFEAACEAVGTSVDSMHTSVQALIMMTEDQSTIDAVMGGPMGDRAIAGSNDHIVEQLGRYKDLGFDEVIVPDITLGGTAEERIAAFAKFADEIAPQLG